MALLAVGFGLLLGALAAPQLALAAPVRVALVVHPVINVTEAESKPIVAALAAAMRQRYQAEIVSGDAVRSKLPSSLPEDCVSDAQCIGEVGDRVGADQLLFLVIVRVGPKVQIDATWAEIRTGRSVPRDTIELDDAGPPRDEVLAEVAPTMLPRGTVATVESAKPRGQAPAETKAEGRLPPAPTSSPWEAGNGSRVGLDTVAWGAAGVAAVSLGVGVALVLGGLADYDQQLELGCDQRQGEARGTCVALTDRFATRSTVANMLILGAGLSAATSIALFAASAAQEDSWALSVTPDGVGVSYGGRF